MFNGLTGFSIIYLLSQPLHCLVMCGPQFLLKNSRQQWAYLVGRGLSYSATSAAFGFFGQTLYAFLEFQFLRVAAFLIFVVVSGWLLWSWWGRPGIPKDSGGIVSFAQTHLKSSFVHGVVSIGLPCAPIVQMLSLSVLSSSLIGGLLIGLGFSILSGGIFLLGRSWAQYAHKKFRGLEPLIKYGLLFFIILNLLHFLLRLAGPASQWSSAKIQEAILCF